LNVRRTGNRKQFDESANKMDPLAETGSSRLRPGGHDYFAGRLSQFKQAELRRKIHQRMARVV
jgi:hypothetical protein